MKTSPRVKVINRQLTDILTENPVHVHLWREVHPHEAGDTLSLALLGDLQHVVSPSQGEGLAVEHEVDVRQRVDGVTVHEELTSPGNQLNTSDLPVDGPGLISGSDQEAGASVNNGLTAWGGWCKC